MKKQHFTLTIVPLLLSTACASRATTPETASSTEISPSALSAEASPDTPPEPKVFTPGPSPEAIRMAVRGKQSDFRQCYIAGTFKNSELRGTVEVQFTIDTDGRVTAKKTQASLTDPEVVDCVVSVFASLQFPAGASGITEVTYPITFGSHG